MFDSDDNDREQQGNFTRRGLLLGAGQLALFGGLGARFYQLQVVERARYAPLADQNRMDVQIIPAVRGRILDRAGLLLADNEEAFRVTLTPALCADIKGVLRRLSRILPISIERREQLLVRARRQSRNTPLVIAPDITFEQLAEINVLTPQLSGVRTEIAWRRRYTEGETMGHVVGYVGSVDRSVLDADDDAVLRVPGMKVGKAGVELTLEPDLRGKAGAERAEVDARGRIVRNLTRADPAPGRDVRLTIDARLQQRVLARLAKERQGAVVALDVETGEVLVMASVPTFDPSDLAAGLTSQTWRRLVTIASRPMLNRAVAGLYPPGSTFKMITALAALHAGVIQPKDGIACDGTFGSRRPIVSLLESPWPRDERFAPGTT
jgi:penicillin-binding protein 2